MCQPSAPLPQSKSQQKPEEVIRVNTTLAQTDVLVLDKKGEFVEGLKSDQFELRVDGRVRSLAHFDRVVTGGASEAEKLAAARGQSTAGAPTRVSLDRGRTILFYIDDYHLSSDSINRTREMLEDFVATQMKAEDQVALVTATGQLGFLEQLVEDKFVLSRAIAKLSHRNFGSVDADRTPMSESEAAAILEDDRRVLDYFVDQILKEMGRLPRGASPRGPKTRLDAETMVKTRAKSIVDQSTSLAVATLSSLERVIRLTADLPWRKTVFFISDGFVLYDRSNPGTDLARIADAAARAITVIYSIDARGLNTGITEASRKMAFDYGRNSGTDSGALTLSQEPLQTLAVDTGGRAILNSNAPGNETRDVLHESSSYYLLSWQLDENDLASHDRQRIEVSIPSRSDLTVRVRHAYLFDGPLIARPAKPAKKKKEEESLSAALHSLAPRTDLPVFLSVGYRKGEAAMAVISTIEVPVWAFDRNNAADSAAPQLDVMGAAVDITGKPVAVFDQTLTVNPSEIRSTNAESALYSHEIGLSPGLYQIRVAVRDKGANRIGSSAEWIEIPNPQDNSLTLSSLFIGTINTGPSETGKLSVNAAHRFRSGSALGFFLIIYNATMRASASDVALLLQVFRDGQPVITKPLVTSPNPATTITYGEDLSLENLPAGKYVLQITAIDLVAKSSAQQRARFVIF